MIDVHPPHKPIHGWRDFLLHIATITIGLLIALGLEGFVEWTHHQHLLRVARENIRREIEDNAELLKKNRSHLEEDNGRLDRDVRILRELRSHPHEIHESVNYNVGWSSFSDAAWRTARDTGALSYMPYAEAQHFSTIYGQQDYINGLGVAIFTEQLKINPAVSRSLNEFSASELEDLARRTTDLYAQTGSTVDLLRSLEFDYNDALK